MDRTRLFERHRLERRCVLDERCAGQISIASGFSAYAVPADLIQTAQCPLAARSICTLAATSI